MSRKELSGLFYQIPNTTYSEALAELKSMSLSERRDELYKKTIKKIVKGTFYLTYFPPPGCARTTVIYVMVITGHLSRAELIDLKTVSFHL